MRKPKSKFRRWAERSCGVIVTRMFLMYFWPWAAIAVWMVVLCLLIVGLVVDASVSETKNIYP